MALAGLLAYALRHSSLDLPARYWAAITTGTLLCVIIRAALPQSRHGGWAGLKPNVTALALTAVALVTLAYMMKLSDGFSRLWAAYWMISAWAVLAVLDLVGAKDQRCRRIIVAGPDTHTLPLRARCADKGLSGVSFKSFGELLDWLHEHHSLDGLVDEIIVVGPPPGDKERSALILALHGNPVDLRYGVDLGEVIPGGWSDGPLGQLTVPLARPQPLGQRLVKRAEDLLLTLLGLPVLLPVMALIALVVTLDSPGPILFRQRRLGLGGKAFTILKFRTMRANAAGEAEAPQALDGDARVTAVGRVLRRTGLDELPQIFNVLAGEMSLVGPRPHAFPHDVAWSASISGYTRRFDMKPGVTGLAQVLGHRGVVEEKQAIDARLALDLEYIQTWSLLSDLRILIRTLVNLRSSRPD